MSSCVFNAYLIRPWLLWVFVVLFSFGFLGRPAASAAAVAAGTLPKFPSFNFSVTHKFTRIAKKKTLFLNAPQCVSMSHYVLGMIASQCRGEYELCFRSMRRWHHHGSSLSHSISHCVYVCVPLEVFFSWQVPAAHPRAF